MIWRPLADIPKLTMRSIIRFLNHLTHHQARTDRLNSDKNYSLAAIIYSNNEDITELNLSLSGN